MRSPRPHHQMPASGAAGRIPRGWRPALWWGLTCLVVGAVAASIAVWKLKPPPPPAPQPVSRFTIALPPGEELTPFGQCEDELPVLALSPDGTHLVYAASRGGSQQLYLRALDQLVSRPMPGTEGGYAPFFSPDGQWVGFLAELSPKLKKVAIGGGAPSTLCGASGNTAASWGPDDTIVFTAIYPARLMRVSAAGGTPQVLTTPDSRKGEIISFPEFLPDGKSILLSLSGDTPGESQIVVQSLETGARQVLVQGPAFRSRYVPTGHILYSREGSLMAVPFDLERLKVTGSPAQIMEGIGALRFFQPRNPRLWATRRTKPRLGRSQGNGTTRGGTAQSLRLSSAVAGGSPATGGWDHG